MANPTLILTPYSAQPGGGSNTNNSFNEQFPYTLSQSLLLIGKISWLLLLIGLFVLSFVVWIWLASFRSGWRFCSWAETRPQPQQVTIGLLYGLIILVTSPFFLFVDWAQKQFDKVLPEWMKLPAQVPFRQLFQERLGITLGDEFPFFIDKDPEDAKLPAEQAAKTT